MSQVLILVLASLVPVLVLVLVGLVLVLVLACPVLVNITVCQCCCSQYLRRRLQLHAARPVSSPRLATEHTAGATPSCCPCHARRSRATSSSDSPSGRADSPAAGCASRDDTTATCSQWKGVVR